ncbi:MAG: Uma2 family endonuclease [Chloracidobacterium sp.]|nr:Uma2 family endonuclease [Chloracidobacterium sp.]MDW8218420.1 Uma2 family endonuclease [Acidobacteriota bacterium]
MTHTPAASTAERRMTFEEYLRYDDGTDMRYELVRGLLVPMANPPAEHELVVSYAAGVLLRHVARHGLPYVVRVNAGVQTEVDTSRLPDIAVYDAVVWEWLLREGGAAVLRLGEPMRLVVEVTSENWREDYDEKRAEYEWCGIPEYWVIDRRRQMRALAFGQDGKYVEEVLRPGGTLRSRVLEGFVTPVESLLSPPSPEEVVQEELARLAQAQEEALEARRLLEVERQRANAERRRAEAAEAQARRLAERLRALGLETDDL